MARGTGNTAFVAWLVGVGVDEVRAYNEAGDPPSHWEPKATAHLRRLGVSTEAEAREIYEKERAA